MVAGCCYGVNFIPVIYIQENPHLFNRPPVDGIAFAHSHFTGILLASTAFFIGYSIYVSAWLVVWDSRCLISEEEQAIRERPDHPALNGGWPAVGHCTAGLVRGQ